MCRESCADFEQKACVDFLPKMCVDLFPWISVRKSWGICEQQIRAEIRAKSVRKSVRNSCEIRAGIRAQWTYTIHVSLPDVFVPMLHRACFDDW